MLVVGGERVIFTPDETAFRFVVKAMTNTQGKGETDVLDLDSNPGIY
jgi:hypothetical protein